MTHQIITYSIHTDKKKLCKESLREIFRFFYYPMRMCIQNGITKERKLNGYPHKT